MTLVYFLISILFLILIHEWGHFAAARFFGVGVEKFSIGFGKALFAYTDEKTGTRWQFGPIPLGGFVGLLGEKNEAINENQKMIVQGKPFMQAPLHAKIVILLAGVTVNLLFAALAFACLAFHSANPALPILAKPPAGSVAYLAGVQSEDLVLSVNSETTASWRDLQVKLLTFAALEESKQLPIVLTVVRSKQQLQLNLNQAIPFSSFDNNSASPEAQLGLRLHAVGLKVQGFATGSAAEQAGLKIGDVLVNIDSLKIDHPSVLVDSLKTYQSVQNGVDLGFKRNGEQSLLRVIPIADEQKNYKLGIQFAPLPKLSEYPIGPFAALSEGVSTTYIACAMTVKAFVIFLSNPFKMKQLAGPVTIAQTAKASADRGWEAALAFLAGLSVSVGVLNLLPVPVLDGGQVLYHLGRSTALRLRRWGGLSDGPFVPTRFAMIFDKVWLAIGASFILLLTLVAFYTDFLRLLTAQ